MSRQEALSTVSVIGYMVGLYLVALVRQGLYVLLRILAIGKMG